MTTNDEIMHAIGRLQGSQEAMQRETHQLREEVAGRMSNHSDRIRSLERFRAGVASVGSLIILIPGVGWLIKHFNIG